MKTLNMNPDNIMSRVLQIYGEDWEEQDLPSYYRKEVKKFKEEQNGIEEEKRISEDNWNNLGERLGIKN